MSPKQVITQTIGITEVSIAYHRPQVRDRQIWGSLVPYGQVWRAGANDNTTITFSDPVRIEGHELAAGTYGLHMVPGEQQWEVIFSTNASSWGSYSYDSSEDALRVTVRPRKAPFEEALQYRFDYLTRTGAVVALRWAELEVAFEIGVETDALVLAKIRADLRHVPGFFWMGWASAANYCLQNQIHYGEALEWADRALSMEENFETLRLKSALLKRLGREEEAMALTEKSLVYANERQTNALGYELLERGEVDKALEVFEKNARDHPESWNVWDSLGEAQAGKGLTEQAIESYSRARELAPEDQQERIGNAIEKLRGR